MAKSIIKYDDFGSCYLCGSHYNIEMHHCVFGRFRRLSDKYGLIVPLCRKCHYDIHHDIEKANYLKQVAQKTFNEKYGEGSFVRIFGVNFLD